MACFTWNQGDCRFPVCKYCHVCVGITGLHTAHGLQVIERARDTKMEPEKHSRWSGHGHYSSGSRCPRKTVQLCSYEFCVVLCGVMKFLLAVTECSYVSLQGQGVTVLE